MDIDHEPRVDAAQGPQVNPFATPPGSMTPSLSSSSVSLQRRAQPSTPGSSGIKPSESMERVEAYQIVSAQLYREAQGAGLFAELDDVWNGVALRFARGHYIKFPAEDVRLDAWVHSLHELNPQATLSVTSAVVAGLAVALDDAATDICLDDGDRLQVIDSTPQLAMARKAQGACFVRSEGRLYVWTDTVKALIPTAKLLEAKLVQVLWNLANDDPNSDDVSEKAIDMTFPAPAAVAPQQKKTVFNRLFRSKPVVGGVQSTQSEKTVQQQSELGVAAVNVLDCENGGAVVWERKTVILSSLYTGLAVGLNVVLMGVGLRTILSETLLDHQYIRFALILSVPPLMCIIQFMCENIIGVLAQLLMPISQMRRNTLYYSGRATPRSALPGTQLPHFTIQMPVYKEGFASVLVPTLESIKQAITTYELQGGSANILVCEDGMQLLDGKEASLRRDYYDRNNIGWVARPKHGKDGFVRKGRFKKASNLNYTCNLSLRLEQIMDEHRPARRAMLEQQHGRDTWYQEDEVSLYNECLAFALAESQGKAWGAGDIRIGDYILLIDSDTRVPRDCFLDAACELESCPDVGVLQHCSGVMYVANHYFEKMIGFFTKVVNFSISWGVANGNVAPFMGHNAFLRWSALQDVMFTDDTDGERCVWSTKHVSEDFDMALRLLMRGYLVRWATYSNNEFLEGVSLTPDDEINRWQKYAFGCSELVFNPLRQWFTRGPITPLFRTFLWSNCTTAYKFTACSYIFSYWAIATAPPVTIAMFVLQGLWYPLLDPLVITLTPFKIWLTVLVVFVLGGNLGQVVCRSRAGQTTLLKALIEHISWIPALSIFFTGISYHIMIALIGHIVGYDMSWSATIKDFDENESNFWHEIPAIFRRYWHCFLVMFTFAAGMAIVYSPLLPMEWRMTGFSDCWSGLCIIVAHIIFPIVLNPWLMRFEF